MSRELIICGYPGVGKSSIAGWNNCIDLETEDNWPELYKTFYNLKEEIQGIRIFFHLD